MRFLSGFEANRTLLLAVVTSTCFLIALGTGLSASITPVTKKHFEISRPDLTMLQAGCSEDDGPCSKEAVKLASALYTLEQAQAAAEEAYEAWVNCLDANGGGPTPNPSLPEKTFSILEPTR